MIRRNLDNTLSVDDRAALDRLILEGHKTGHLVELFGMSRAGVNARKRKLRDELKPPSQHVSVKRPESVERATRKAILPVATSEWMRPITREQLMAGR